MSAAGVDEERIGFIGLGAIGAPMAERVAAAGHALVVWNRTPAKAQPLLDRGARAAASVAALAAECGIVLLCVTDGAAVEELVFGAGGLVSSACAGTLIVDLSTIHPQLARTLATRWRERNGGGWVDAPVSGGPDGARAGTLAVMAGGDAADVERARPVLMSFARQVSAMGPVGCGLVTKACNQMINWANATAIAEAMNLATRFGMDPARLPDALAGGYADSGLLRSFGPRMASGQLSGDMAVTLKDQEIVLDLGRGAGAPMPLTSLIASFYRLLESTGRASGGTAGIVRLYRSSGAAIIPQDHDKP